MASKRLKLPLFVCFPLSGGFGDATSPLLTPGSAASARTLKSDAHGDRWLVWGDGISIPSSTRFCSPRF